jgi:hypothetical protein
MIQEDIYTSDNGDVPISLLPDTTLNSNSIFISTLVFIFDYKRKISHAGLYTKQRSPTTI